MVYPVIKIRRTSRAPGNLRAQARIQTTIDVVEFGKGVVEFEFDRSIYASEKIKSALVQSQHQKCCYCEKSVRDSYCDVEHFRPKSAVKVQGKKALQRPGYFWLAYDWDNLILSCEPCNRSHKRNQFPLVDELARATGQTLSTATETNLLINPVTELPEQFLTFREEYVVAVDENVRGRATREVLALDREDLNELRREHLKIVKAIVALARQNPPGPESADAQNLLYDMASDKGQFAACTRMFLKNNFGTSDVTKLCNTGVQA